jgi:hypothetical protein
MDGWMDGRMDGWMTMVVPGCISRRIEEEEEEGRVCLWMKVGTLVHPGWPYFTPLN